MAHDLTLTATDRAGRYGELEDQLTPLLESDAEPIAAMANLAAGLREALGFFWVGFYRVMGQELVLGPFQGPVACTRIAYGRGVCGTAWARGETLLVPDVEAFEGHIACSSAARSEVVVPIRQGGHIVAVLDVDSDKLDDFGPVDLIGLERLCELLARTAGPLGQP